MNPPFNCSFAGNCESDPYGTYQTLQDCEEECTGRDQKEILYEYFLYTPADARHLAPSDRTAILQRLTNSPNLQFSVEDSYHILEFLDTDFDAHPDLRIDRRTAHSLGRYPALWPYLYQHYEDDDITTLLRRSGVPEAFNHLRVPNEQYEVYTLSNFLANADLACAAIDFLQERVGVDRTARAVHDVFFYEEDDALALRAMEISVTSFLPQLRNMLLPGLDWLYKRRNPIAYLQALEPVEEQTHTLRALTRGISTSDIRTLPLAVTWLASLYPKSLMTNTNSLANQLTQRNTPYFQFLIQYGRVETLQAGLTEYVRRLETVDESFITWLDNLLPEAVREDVIDQLLTEQLFKLLQTDLYNVLNRFPWSAQFIAQHEAEIVSLLETALSRKVSRFQLPALREFVERYHLPVDL